MRCSRTSGSEEYGPFTCGGEVAPITSVVNGNIIVDYYCKTCGANQTLAPDVIRNTKGDNPLGIPSETEQSTMHPRWMSR